MAQPTVVCLERRRPETGEPFVRCVALPGRAPGLGLAHDGSIVWMASEGVACSLGMSGDGQLILLRNAHAPAIRVLRSGRSLDVQADKLVVLLHGDEVELAGLRWRVHVHGPAREVAPPRALTVAAWAAAVALAVTSSTSGCTPSRSSPATLSDASAETSPEASAAVGSGAADAASDSGDGPDAPRDADGVVDAGADAEAGFDAAVRKPRPASPKPARKEPIEVRDFPPYVD